MINLFDLSISIPSGYQFILLVLMLTNFFLIFHYTEYKKETNKRKKFLAVFLLGQLFSIFIFNMLTSQETGAYGESIFGAKFIDLHNLLGAIVYNILVAVTLLFRNRKIPFSLRR